MRFRPGIWDGGATSSTGSWTCVRRSTHGYLGFTPKRGSKQCGIDILPIFLLRFGSSLQMWMASLASQVTWEGSLSIMLKLESDGNGWWWSVHGVSIWQRWMTYSVLSLIHQGSHPHSKVWPKSQQKYWYNVYPTLLWSSLGSETQTSACWPSYTSPGSCR